jgi:hypothetical protein
MPGRQDGGDRFGEHELGREVVDQRRASEAGVQITGAKAGDELRDRHLVRLERNVGVARTEGPHDRRHHVVGDRAEEADTQLAFLTGGGAADGGGGTLGVRDQRARFAQQHDADGREPDPP